MSDEKHYSREEMNELVSQGKMTRVEREASERLARLIMGEIDKNREIVRDLSNAYQDLYYKKGVPCNYGMSKDYAYNYKFPYFVLQIFKDIESGKIKLPSCQCHYEKLSEGGEVLAIECDECKAKKSSAPYVDNPIAEQSDDQEKRLFKPK